MRVLGENIGSINGPTFALAAASLALILFWPKKWQRRVPGSIAALFLGTLAVALWNLPVETIGSPFRRHPARPTQTPHSGIVVGQHSAPVPAGHDDRVIGSH
jgi:MFS superfamily sulfate permease-like transporter